MKKPILNLFNVSKRAMANYEEQLTQAQKRIAELENELELQMADLETNNKTLKERINELETSLLEAGNDNKVTLEEAAVMNCYLCSGFHSKYHPKPYHQSGHEGYLHGGETASSDSIPCQSSQLWEYIGALSKET